MPNEVTGKHIAFLTANENASGTWVDQEVRVCTNGPNALVPIRTPDDLPASGDQLLSTLTSFG